MGTIKSAGFIACIGGGNFGTKAALLSKGQNAVTLVIDPSPVCKAREVAERVATDIDDVDFELRGEIQYLQGDGCSLIRDIYSKRCPDILVPASPGHLIAKATVNILSERGMPARPYAAGFDIVRRKLDERVVLTSDRENGVIVASHMAAGGMCISECPQPPVCPVTGNEKGVPMHKMLEEAIEGVCDRCCVFHSVLLGTGGVGGIVGTDIKAFLDELKGIRPGETLALATSCSCHGIVNLIDIYSEK